MKKLFLILPALALSSFVFSGCNLLPSRAPSDQVYTDTPSEITTESELPTDMPVSDEQEALVEVTTDQELLDLLENLDDPSFEADLNTLETNLK